MHLACKLGAHFIIQFLIEFASELGILSLIINQPNKVDITPFYLLCVENQNEKERAIKQHLTIQKFIDGSKYDRENEYKLGKSAPDSIKRKEMKSLGSLAKNR